MKKYFFYLVFLQFSFSNVIAQQISDDFEGNGNITSWFGDDCGIDVNFSNPFQNAGNTSAKVLKYTDNGGQYANVRFDASNNFNILLHPTFQLKIYVPSNGITGNQTNQISFKLQNNTLNEPWTTQTEIIKPLLLDQWQTITFNFEQDNYINIDPNSPAPIGRNDLNRVVIQINGENNTDNVVAYLDDFFYDLSNTGIDAPVYDYLVWSDEFEYNGAVNAEKWFHQTQLPDGGNWYNGEVQHYTNRTANSFVSNGTLKIVAKKETFNDQGQTKQYTSARLNSKFAFKNGRVSVRAKLPFGVGTWPAIWMLGKNIIEPGGFWTNQFGTLAWPACGEIDIMEHWGNNQNYVSSAIHTPSSFGNTINHGGQVIPTVSSAFHDYELIWSPEKMIFSVDGVVHYIYNPSPKNNQTWPFEWEQYLLLNIAIQPSIAANFTESAMEIDYVRVYQQFNVSTTEINENKGFSIFPNPTNHQLNIQLKEEWKGKMATIYSVLGQKVMTIQLENELTKMNIENLSPGIYIINIENFSQKFVKE